MKAPLLLFGSAACYATAIALVGLHPGNLSTFADDLLRPALLPFAWRALDRATREGNGDEAFARAQQLMRLLPGWSDGHAVFAYRFALDAGDATLPPGPAATAALQRLQVALAWLQTARADAGRREVELLQAMAMLVELAADRQPGLEPLLQRWQPGGANAIADGYLQTAEQLGAGHSVREQRIFLTPRLCAGFLRAGDRERALAVLDFAIAQSAVVRDRDLGSEWAAVLGQVRDRLRTGAPIDIERLAKDPRLEPLLPFLR